MIIIDLIIIQYFALTSQNPIKNMSTPMKQPSPAASSSVAASLSPKKMGKFSVFSHLKYEHMVAGISGIVQSLKEIAECSTILSQIRRSHFNAHPAPAGSHQNPLCW